MDMKRFFPYAYIKSIFAVDFAALYAQGYRGVILDIDSTLVPHGEPATPQVEQLFERIHAAGLKTVLLTNNDEARVRRFVTVKIETLFVCDAQKPEKVGYERALRLLGTAREQTLAFGDQIFTDIYGANRCGVPCVLVEYITKPGETKIGIRRRVEKLVLFFYRHSPYRDRIRDVIKTEKEEAVREKST